jgi:hypothetical protein
METKLHSVCDFLSVVPLNAHLTYLSYELKKELKCQEVILPRRGPFEVEDVGPGVGEVEHSVDEARK